MATIIGLSGRRRSGKDTAATILANHRYYQRVAFAAPLKSMLATLLAYQGYGRQPIVEALEGEHKELPCAALAGRTPRHAMQTLGTEWGRDQIAPDYWVHLGIEMAKRNTKSVITDVRFHNEHDAIKYAGGTVIRIVRKMNEPTEADEHISEKIIPCDVIIENNGTLEDFEEEVLRYADSI